MNTDELTLGQMKEIKAMIGGSGCGVPAAHPYAGKLVIVRTRVAGVHVGKLVSFDREVGVRLSSARRLWSWSGGANTLNEVATRGPDTAKLSEPVDDIILTESADCELLPVTGAAVAKLTDSKW